MKQTNNDKLGRIVVFSSLFLVPVFFVAMAIAQIVIARVSGHWLVRVVISAVLAALTLWIGHKAWRFRLMARTWYGMLELYIAVWAVASAVFTGFESVRTAVAAIGGVYIAVRGYDNLDEGLRKKHADDTFRKWWIQNSRKQDY